MFPYPLLYGENRGSTGTAKAIPMSPELIAAVCAILTCLGCSAMVLFRGGALVGRVEVTLTRLAGIEAKLEAIPNLESKIDVLSVKIGVVEAVAERQRSDFKDLAVRVTMAEKDSAHVRGRLDSEHNE